jgi:hypothetical protein
VSQDCVLDEPIEQYFGPQLMFENPFFCFKGIASRDLHLCVLVSVGRSEVHTTYGAVRFLLKFHFRVSA